MIYFPSSKDFFSCENFELNEIKSYKKTRFYEIEGKTDDLVLFFHGNAGSACDRIETLNILKKTKNNIIIVEYSGYGGDGNNPNMKDILDNVKDIGEYINGKKYDKVYVIGRSLGTGIAGYYVKNFKVNKVLLISPYSQLSKVAKGKYPIFPISFLFSENYETENYLDGYKNDILIIHGKLDKVISSLHGKELYEGLKTEKKEFIYKQDGTHHNILDYKNIREKIILFLQDDLNIAFLGDVMIGGRVGEAINENGLDYSFSGTTSFLSKKDMIVLNLETTVTDSKSKVNKSYTFKANSKHLEGLKKFNDNLYVNLANNHIGDFKKQGMIDTMSNLNKYNIGYFGLGNNIEEANNIKIISIKETKIGLIGQNCIFPIYYKAGKDKVGSAFFDKDILKKEIEKAKKEKVDIIVLNAHCGIEYTNGPDIKQKEYYHFAIDSGVDLVIGHHPHWYQGIEKYKGKIIFYSLGDYIFDIFRGRRTKEGLIADIKIKNKKIFRIDIEAVHIYDYGNTQLATEEQKKIILNELQKLSNELGIIETIKEGYINLKY